MTPADSGAHSERWGDYDWQLIRDQPTHPMMHMAIDEVLTTEVGDGRRPPTLRIWEWGAPAVVIGSFQSLANEVDAEGADHGLVTEPEPVDVDDGPPAVVEGPGPELDQPGLGGLDEPSRHRRTRRRTRRPTEHRARDGP